MKKLLKIIINVCAWLVSKIFNSYYFSFSNYFKNRVFTYGIVGKFKSIGKNPKFDRLSIIHNPCNIIIGDNFYSMQGFRLEAWTQYEKYNYNPLIIIGNNVSFNCNCHLACINKVIIEDNVLVAGNVFITDHYHGDNTPEMIKIEPLKRELYTKGSVVIKKNVWIGEGVVILPDVTIGENSVVGANSVVTKSFPANSIIAGIPARIIRSIK